MPDACLAFKHVCSYNAHGLKFTVNIQVIWGFQLLFVAADVVPAQKHYHILLKQNSHCPKMQVEKPSLCVIQCVAVVSVCRSVHFSLCLEILSVSLFIFYLFLDISLIPCLSVYLSVRLSTLTFLVCMCVNVFFLSTSTKPFS